MSRYIKQIIFVSLVGIFFTFIYTPNHSYAEAKYELDIKVESGINGKAQQQKGFPITISITNNEADFSGDLVITVPKGYESAGNIVIPVEIATGTTKEFQVSVPAFEPGYLQMGPSSSKMPQLIHLYEGSWKDDKEVKIDKNIKIQPSFLPDNRLIVGVLSEQPDALNYLKLSTFYGNSPEILNLKEKDLPNESIGLEVLDVLMINDYSITSLPKEKQNAIKEWVEDGGQLIVGSTPGLKKEMGELEGILPVEITSTKSIHKLSKLEEFANSSFPNESIDLYTGKLRPNAEVIYYEGKDPLISQTQDGQGRVSLIHYDLSASTVTNWKGYEEAWQKVSSRIILTEMQDEESIHRVSQLSNDLSYQSTMFKSLAKIPLSVLVISFFIYVFVIAPILYFLLKRMDKREWSWVIIPSIAVICSIALYFVGAKDRIGQIQSNANAVVLLDGQGNGTGYGSVSMLSKDSGDYVVTVDPSLQPFPSNSNRYGGISQPNNVKDLPVIETKQEETDITFQNVEFWSPRSIGIQVPDKEYGMFETNLVYEGGKITGTIMNNTPYDFQELLLVSGTTHIKLGVLKAGETAKVDESFKRENLFQPPNEQAAYNIYGNSGNFLPDWENESKQQLLQTASWSGMSNVGTQGPSLIGFTNNELVDFKVNGKNTKNNSLNLFAQTVEIGISKNLTKPLTVNLSVPKVDVVSGQINYSGLRNGDNFIDVQPGVYEFVYTLPTALQKDQFKIENLSFTMLQPQGNVMAFEIYNQKTEEFEAINIGGADKIEGDAILNYLFENAQIRLRTNSSANAGTIAVPTMEVKGVPNK